jgi:hypothetical protein
VPTSRGDRGAGTNYRGPAVRKLARSPTMLLTFSSFSVLSLFVNSTNYLFLTKPKSLCKRVSLSDLVQRILACPLLLGGSKPFFFSETRFRSQRPCGSLKKLHLVPLLKFHAVRCFFKLKISDFVFTNITHQSCTFWRDMNGRW